MALIQCPECNKSISDKALSCPHCGFPLQPVQPEPVQPKPVQPKHQQLSPEKKAELDKLIEEMQPPASQDAAGASQEEVTRADKLIGAVVLVCVVGFLIWYFMPVSDEAAIQRVATAYANTISPEKIEKYKEGDGWYHAQLALDLKRISLSDCPDDFKKAYEDYMESKTKVLRAFKTSDDLGLPEVNPLTGFTVRRLLDVVEKRRAELQEVAANYGVDYYFDNVYKLR